MKRGQQLKLDQIHGNGNFCVFFFFLNWSTDSHICGVSLSLLQFKCDYKLNLSMMSSDFQFYINSSVEKSLLCPLSSSSVPNLTNFRYDWKTSRPLCYSGKKFRVGINLSKCPSDENNFAHLLSGTCACNIQSRECVV